MGFRESSWNILCDKFGDPCCICFGDIVREKQIHRQKAVKNPTPATTVGMVTTAMDASVYTCRRMDGNYRVNVYKIIRYCKPMCRK